jgi:tellurite resistance protein TehA-like permease
MTPVWVFPVYPLLIVAPLAASLINSIPSTTETLHISSQTIIVGAIALQGIGFLVSVIIYNAFIYRLMTHGLPSPQCLPMMFISVGPAGFTATGVIQFGSLASKAIPMMAVGNSDTVSLIVRVLAYSVGVCLWGVTMWFFILSVGGQWRLVCVKESRIHFDVSLYAFIFPNSALTSSTHAVGKAFDWYPVQIMGCVMATALIAAWLLVSSKVVWAIWRRKILWP